MRKQQLFLKVDGRLTCNSLSKEALKVVPTDIQRSTWLQRTVTFSLTTDINPAALFGLNHYG